MALARRTGRQADSRHRAGRVLAGAAGEVASPLHITGCYARLARSAHRVRGPTQARTTPVMSCAHSAPAAWPAGYSSPRSNTQGLCGHGQGRHRKGSGSGAARGAVMVLAPAQPPIRPPWGLPGFVEASKTARRPRLAMRCKPTSRLTPHSKSVLKTRRVKGSLRRWRALDPGTTCARAKPQTASG